MAGAIVNRDGIDGHELFERLSQGEIKSGGFDLNGLWSPWYTLHKTYAGLRDAFRTLTPEVTAMTNILQRPAN